MHGLRRSRLAINWTRSHVSSDSSMIYFSTISVNVSKLKYWRQEL